MDNWNMVPMQDCEQPKCCEPDKISDRLKARRLRLESQLADVSAAEAALANMPDLAKWMDAVKKGLG